MPRDRQGSFEPLLIPKHERRFTGFDDKIVALYGRGMTAREIQAFLAEQYATEMLPEFISSVTDAVMTEVSAWQSRRLEPMYLVVFFDALPVQIREDAVVRNKAICLALGVLAGGTRDIQGLWIECAEGAKFWLKVFNDLKTRGVGDILIAVTDGLKGIPEALPTSSAGGCCGSAGRSACRGLGTLVYALHCPELDALFLLVWIGLGMMLAAVLGVVLAPRWMRW